VVAPLQHAATVTSAMFSADGTRVVTASGDRTARVWDARTGQPLGAPLQHGATVTSATFSADGTRVVTASDDHTARVWDARTGQPVGAPLQHGARVTSATFSADGTRVVTADDKTARVWDVAAGRSRDAGIIAEAAEALSEYTVNEASSLIRLDNAAVRATSLRQRVAHVEFVEPSATWMLHWFFEDPWDRTVSPLSSITVNDYIIGRLKQCTYEARTEAESHFVGHPLLLKLKEFCPGTVALNANSTMLSQQRRR
jgi:WD40 repeat protein